ncbi:tripartite motif-containing protein 2-like [Strongylocentrotus purpuratus]|uniref:Uncharacterized protein n=1 Tax=Strongylocentrotus purpuratus TaxID=7668 RepID=A0A7M7HH68_STRPU|nr:tripartite motif-containing protein 2-like [Strongylocentrotus purpuratus]|eukprot:XP_011666889.1 PREDICTED: tripartite motif-containing protein 2-like [Strongylocentrotus purpuratus]
MHKMAATKQLSDSLQCPICTELLSKPKLLPCSHSFCGSCLYQLHSFKGFTVTISCPVCRQVAHVPRNNVCNFPTNQIAKSLAEDFKKQSDTKARSGKRHGACSGQPCTVCDGDDRDIATYYCQNCSEFLCDHCLQQHKKYKRNTLHEVVKARDIQSGFVKMKFACPEHPQELQQFVCITCLDRICCRCLEVTHRADGHEVIGMTEYEESQQQTFEFLLQKTEQRSVVIQNRLSFVKEKLQTVKNSVSQRQQEIKNTYDVAAEQLRRRKCELLDECNTYRNTFCHKLEDIIDCHNDFLETISDKASLVNEGVKRPHHPDLSISEHAARVDGLETILKGGEEALSALIP